MRFDESVKMMLLAILTDTSVKISNNYTGDRMPFWFFGRQ